MRRKVAVLVAGSWGTALASVLADNELDVWLWSRNAEQVREINHERTNNRFLQDVKLNAHIQATSSMKEAVQGAEAVVIVSPSSGMREVVKQLRPFVNINSLIVHATKGFETDTLCRMSQVIIEELPDTDPNRVVVLSGPSHAEEVILKCPTTVVVAASDRGAAEQAQDLFINNYFRVYTNPDVVGVEVGGALKNIIGIGAGITEGLGFGDNAKAALLTRGLTEIARLGSAMGADAATFSGLAGLGDLIATGTSKHSRNWRAGHALAQGKSLEEVLSSMGMVVEGVRTTQAAFQLSNQYGVVMPITAELHQVLFKGKSPKDAVVDLMARGRTHEIEEIADKAQTGWTN
jgi:glycerol-3-phosphate dehydrogenase (NAD(P)+)